jgi:hypothetical protein
LEALGFIVMTETHFAHYIIPPTVPRQIMTGMRLTHYLASRILLFYVMTEVCFGHYMGTGTFHV